MRPPSRCAARARRCTGRRTWTSTATAALAATATPPPTRASPRPPLSRSPTAAPSAPRSCPTSSSPRPVRSGTTATTACGGSVAAVVYRDRVSYAVVGDTGPTDIIGEASYAAAKSLGVDPDPRSGGAPSGVTYIVFKDSRVTLLEDKEAAQTQGSGWHGVRRFQGLTVPECSAALTPSGSRTPPRPPPPPRRGPRPWRR
ncbi:glycoside hydrolase family 75 protein [Streptomyces thermocarboxydus]